MADEKLTEKTENVAPALTDLIEIVDDPGGTPLTQKQTVGNLLNSGLITIVGTVVTGDATAIVDAATEGAAGKVEIATAAEINTGDDGGRVPSADSLRASVVGTIYDRDISDVTVGNTVNETSIYSFTLNADDLGATGNMRIIIYGTVDQDSGANKTLVIRLKLGATTLAIATSIFVTGATAGGFKVEAMISNTATNVQFATAGFHQMRGASNTRSDLGVGTGAEDTTGNLTVDVTAQWSAADADTTLTKKAGYAELKPTMG